ncbi:hypothetical protein ABT189_16950 [Streptomyces sp900105755]|uniref:hypothetical protein n=1 Tax=Streptomyces sp. 900105755 TaxID=3154389 RepID=UPI00333083E0
MTISTLTPPRPRTRPPPRGCGRCSRKVLAAHGDLPALPQADYRPAAGTVDADILDQWKAVSEKDGLLPCLDYTTQTFHDTLTAAVQELTAGQLSPQALGAQLQSDYASFQQSS